MTSCDRCAHLLLDYVAAGNQVVELKQHGDAPPDPLARAMAKRAQARRLLAQYRRNRRCDAHCPNHRRVLRRPKHRTSERGRAVELGDVLDNGAGVGLNRA